MSDLTEVTSSKSFGGFQKVFNHKRYYFIDYFMPAEP